MRLSPPHLIVTVLAVATAAACGGRSAAPPATTPTVTFNKDVAPIVFANCAPCHRPGEVAPFSLLNYADAAKHADGMIVLMNRLPWSHPLTRPVTSRATAVTRARCPDGIARASSVPTRGPSIRM